MPIIRDLSELPETARGGAVAIGNFDGVHLGHLRIVQRLLQRARAVSGPAIVFTFDPHPVRILRPAAARFVRFYLLKGGFLLGWKGLLLAYLAAHYVRLKYAKLLLLQRGLPIGP